MKNLKPAQILLSGSATVGALMFVLLLCLYFTADAFHPVYLIIFPPATAVFTYITFYFFIKLFITERLRLLYRSIRKGKFSSQAHEQYSLSQDIIGNAEIETRKWTDERMKEISELRAQEEFRKEFLGNLAHELKTPVFSIQGYILTLLEGGLEDENVNRNFLERASKATERMANILEDLDQLTKMQVNAIPIEKVNFDICELISDLFEDLSRKAKKKKISLKIAKKEEPVFVYADKTKIGQVLTNLIHNSISYGNENGETVVHIYQVDDIVTIEVSDNGPGIDEQHLPRLFERFYRVEKSRNRNDGGSGLGLSIAKHIIAAHGQTINVRSTLDVGSTFTFSLDKGKRE